MNRFLFPVTVAFSASSLLLVDFAIKGAALLVFALLVVSLLRRDSAAARHLVWMASVVAMLFVPALSALLPQWRVLPEEQLRSVLLHELAHIRRRDALAQLLAQIACAMHWFNPLVWFAWRLHVERERACDDLVLQSGVRASAYAEHLLNVATKLSSSRWTQACGLAMARSSSLHGRLAAVLSEKRNRRSVSTSVVAVCVLLAATILIPVAMVGAVDEDQPGQTAKQETKDSSTVTATANEELTVKLPPGLEEHLDWSEPVNGLRAAIRIRTMDSPGIAGKERKIFIVIQNISDKPIRFCDSAIHETDVPAADTEGRTLYLSDNGETLLGIQRAKSMRIDLVLQPRDIFSLDMFDDEKANQQGRKSGDVFAEGIVKLPSEALYAVLSIIHAPDGAWTGKLKTPSTRGAFAVDGPMPKSKEGKALFRYCVDHARLNNEIPGGLISRLRDKVQEFIQLNDGDQFGDPYAKKMQPLVARFEKTGDWNQADVVALFDDIADVTTIPLDTTLDQIRERTLQRGQRLPASFEKVNWGEPLPGGLRMAWVLEPRAEKYHLGSSLKSRVLIQNSGNEPVAFVTRSFHQPEHKASKTDGTAIQMESTFWTTIGRPEPYRLHPGEYCEVYAPGIGIGPNNRDDEDWANIRPGSWILANEDDEIVFQPGDVILSGDHNAQVNPNWWIEFIQERLHRDAPLPADQKEREVILFRVVNDLFGNSPTPEEAAAFYPDMSPKALDNLAQLLSERSWLTPVAGPIQSGKTTFRVLPEDPDAATRVRVAMNPGRYNLGENIRFVVTRRPIGERIVNEASITWYPDGQDSKSHKVPLPDGYDSWAAAWSPGSTVLWVQQKSGTYSYDFSDPGEVKESAVEPEKVPGTIRAAFPAVLATPEAPADACRSPSLSIMIARNQSLTVCSAESHAANSSEDDSVGNVMQHEVVCRLLHFVKLHVVHISPEQMIPQQSCPLSGSRTINAGSSRAFNASIQSNRDLHGLCDLRSGKISEKIARHEAGMGRIDVFPAAVQNACPLRCTSDLQRGKFNADQLGNGVQLPQAIVFAS